jgi:hypothetical protein
MVHCIVIYTISLRNNTVILDTGKTVWKVFSLKEMQVPDGEQKVGIKAWLHSLKQSANSLTQELNPSAQRCLTRFFTEDFDS